MSERRETDRRQRRNAKPSRPARKQINTGLPEDGERIAKYLAHAGICSRREAERLIEEGAVSVNGKRLETPAFKVRGHEEIKVHGKRVEPPEDTRLWMYHKPAGLITATHDPEGRATIFDHLPKSLPRMVTIGRLDLTTEGLLLLTNDGELARSMELPATGLIRRYRARAHGQVTPQALAALAAGVSVDGIRYAPIEAELERTTGTNNWLSVTLREGKNREVRKALASVDLTVNRLIRIQYGPFELEDLKSGTLNELSKADIEALKADGVTTRKMAQPKPPPTHARKGKRGPQRRRF